MDNSSEKSNIIHLLTFSLANEEYGLNIKKIHEIINQPRITFMPQVQHYIDGVFPLRGNILPVYNLKKRLGLTFTEQNSNTKKIIIIEHLGKKLGILVDAIQEVIHIPGRMLIPSPTLKNIKREFIKGVINLENKIIILLEMEKVVG